MKQVAIAKAIDITCKSYGYKAHYFTQFIWMILNAHLNVFQET